MRANADYSHEQVRRSRASIGISDNQRLREINKVLVRETWMECNPHDPPFANKPLVLLGNLYRGVGALRGSVIRLLVTHSAHRGRDFAVISGG